MKIRAVRPFVAGILAVVALVSAGCVTTSGPPPPPPPKLVEAGAVHSCQVDQNRQIACWGQNNKGQLGVGSFTNSPTPLYVLGMSNATAVTASLDHSCAINAGSVYCWGGNPEGQIGDGTTVNKPLPTLVAGLTNITQIGTGIGHSCALDIAGVVKCWGDNSNGQLGDGTTTDRLTPVTVSGLSNVASLAVRGWHTCAVTTSGAPLCWGDNAQGQLGNGSTTDSTAPVAPNGLPTVSEIEVGTLHTCARVGGAVSCWGNGSQGQLGNGGTANSSTPVAVTGLLDATGLALGGLHSCAIVTNGAARCWGFNSVSQLGNGGTANASTPVDVAGLTGITHMSNGLTHTCAVLTGTLVVCWGDNGTGQLGNSSVGAMSTVPVQVEPAEPPPPVVPPNNIDTETNYNLDCETTLGGTPVFNPAIAATTTVSHPETIHSGETFHVVVTHANVEVPLTQMGFSLNNMSTFSLRFPIPAGVDLVSAPTFTPGVNTGPGTVSVTDHGTYVQLDVPGPMTPGTTVTLPSINLELQATAQSGTINFTALGTSYADWSYSFLVEIVLPPAQVAANTCFPNPAPPLPLAAITIN